MKRDFTYREIPYNYTSFSDMEIILKYFDKETWDILDELRNHRVTGRSAKLLFEIIGDIFIIDRNPYIFNDFLENPEKQSKLKELHSIRFNALTQGADSELVNKIITKARKVANDFFISFKTEKRIRKTIFNTLGKITSEKNIHFSAFHKVTHVTDATDWRVEYPQVVVYPENETEIQELVKSAQKLDLKIIARGGGTGLTGGTVPIYKNTMVINTEKLRGIEGIRIESENGKEIPVIRLETGVITETAMHYCTEKGYVFATDPTSAWASTIGGNIAENAGGKKCVIWGTAIDNIYSYDMVISTGKTIRIQRRNHPHRKILPVDTVVFDIYEIEGNTTQKLFQTINLTGTDIRKRGVGKDITNKVLNGLPGIQKEGGDGIIVAAEFILYKPFAECRTVCLEFFGNNLIKASQAIIDILQMYETDSISHLTALEHFDEKYVAAIRYRNKSQRSELPKAVLIIDIEGNESEPLDISTEKLLEHVKQYNAEGFMAITAKDRAAFWKDRKNLGAIARHTNAFKLNEDVVIPIESLPSFADYIEKLNVQKDLENYIYILEEIRNHLLPCKESEDTFLCNKLNSYINSNDDLYSDLKLFVQNMDKNFTKLKTKFFTPRVKKISPTLFETIQNKEINIDFNEIVLNKFYSLFHGYDDLIESFKNVASEASRRHLIIATHMHAGDGNIHVNIPVNSNDYLMMKEADETAGLVMEKTKELGGVISGEHGIGLTKLKFIDQEVLDNYAIYKKEADPQDLFNPGKLWSDFPSWLIYTPSLNLLEMEAFILKAADLEDLTTSISSCVRCGKCKEVCNTHYPGGSMFYPPRNKILGVSLITEAVLYEAQREKSLSFRNFKMLREISSHCTMCHNCEKPCPVDIDFGEVTLDIKKLLVDRHKSSFKFLTWFTLFYLRRRGFYTNKIFRLMLLKIGFTTQRLLYSLNKPLKPLIQALSPYFSAVLSGRFPKSGSKSIREILNLKGANTLFSFADPDVTIKKSVMYFPGCGSERMFPEISISTIALLYNAGIRVVIAPEYLCCGYPLRANGKTILAETKSNENRVIFHRIADTVTYMGINDVIISCGTCREMLSKYHLENVFTECELIDINEFLVREHLYENRDTGKTNILYHEPCHSPLKTMGAEATISSLLNADPVRVENCCGEGGTLALSTPEISQILRTRKQNNIIPFLGKKRSCEVLTTCPSCVGGLNKIAQAPEVKGKSLVEHVAVKYMGPSWKNNFIKKIQKNKGVERIIL